MTRQQKSLVGDGEALALVTEMMAIPGRSGEEAGVLDFIRGKLVEAGVATDLLAASQEAISTPPEAVMMYSRSRLMKLHCVATDVGAGQATTSSLPARPCRVGISKRAFSSSFSRLMRAATTHRSIRFRRSPNTGS